MKKNKKLPDLNKMSYEEEAAFWDSVDITDYLDEFEKVQFVFNSESETEDLHVKIPAKMKESVENVAAKREISVSSQVKIWLEKMLKYEMSSAGVVRDAPIDSKKHQRKKR